MKVKHRDADIPVNLIYPHPDNPRKDLGDITELAESIKQNGIFQNLTVVLGGKGVPLSPEYDEIFGYTVIIGHRRLAAAKAAGLDVVPCMVVEMDEREQAATMLLENMQRSDLTIYEQAQGFQMMLDLGETQEGIAKKTGFSKSTIYHRLKLLELDPEELAKMQDRQATLSDYIELEKIDDPGLKNEALKEIGTANFKWKVQQIIGKEKAIKETAKIKACLSEHFKSISESEKENYHQITAYSPSFLSSEEKIQEEIKRLTDKGVKYFSVSSETSTYPWLFFYADKIEAETDEKERQKEETERKRQERERVMHDLERQAAELRKTFVKNFANREYIGKLTEAMLLYPIFEDYDIFEAARLIGIEEGETDIEESADYREIVRKHPEKVMLALLCTAFDDRYRASLHNFNGEYCKNENLERWYALLTKIGYRMSSDEVKLLAGTHDCYK